MTSELNGSREFARVTVAFLDQPSTRFSVARQVFDVLALAVADGYWSEIAFWMIAAGVVTGLLSAPFGAIDWLAIPSGTRAKRIGAVHGIGDVVVVLLFASSRLMRQGAPAAPGTLALALSVLGGGLALITGWLCGELVDRLGVGVDDGIEDFAVNEGRTNGPASRLRTGGLERPVAVRFDPSGQALYVVDFGVMVMTARKASPQQETGVLWRITREQP